MSDPSASLRLGTALSDFPAEKCLCFTQADEHSEIAIANPDMQDKRKLLAIFPLFLFVSVALGGPFEDARSAAARGDFATAVRILQPLDEQGEPAARYILALAYRDGQGVPQNYGAAIKRLRQVADLGIAPAQVSLGGMYANGQGVRKDFVEAVKWIRLAADQGNADAEFHLGGFYLNGQGVPQDYSESAKWFRLAADRGSPDAQYMTGVMYGKGQGVLQDFVEAHKWLNLAAAHANEAELRNNAITDRARVASMMSSEQVAEAQKLAREWTQK